ncbi:MAG: GNAT family N-acetyltransferase [Chloroflexi bacterium]|nr:GNAT family N-acetyltransferase [Chloroflexota bacterium]MCI0577258.1 GNAT family N-acetyltransferase [Chloroflexota bacterium]MCI0646739.1 GNAT family N-acetyltransferase [Chloroflexota bacterium]MCI0731373.1 GNAT family N-acetyltransferase [Chloroflexota bacterium]
MDEQQTDIRRVQVKDVLAITRMTYANMMGVDPLFTKLVTHPLSRWGSYLFMPFYFLVAGEGYKAVQNGRIVGCAYLHVRELCAYAFNVSVNQPYRRQGVARRLMSYLEEAAQARNVSWMALQVDEANLPARNLYEQLGYRPYHPHFLRREGSATMPWGVASGVGLEPLRPRRGRRLFEHYLALEREAGDRWAARVVPDCDFESLPAGVYWRCLLQGEEIGCALVARSAAGPIIHLMLQPAYWGHFTLAGLVRLLAEKVARVPTTLDLHLGSSAHHQAALPLLAGLGFVQRTVPRILMLKLLKGVER